MRLKVEDTSWIFMSSLKKVLNVCNVYIPKNLKIQIGYLQENQRPAIILRRKYSALCLIMIQVPEFW